VKVEPRRKEVSRVSERRVVCKSVKIAKEIREPEFCSLCYKVRQ